MKYPAHPQTGERQSKCSNCFEVKPISMFYRRAQGHQSRCKACNNEVVASYRRSKAEKDMAARWRALRSGA